MQNNSFLAPLIFSLTAFGSVEPLPNSIEMVNKVPWSFRVTDHFIFSNAPEDGADKSLPSTKTFKNEIKGSGEYGAYNGYLKLSNQFTLDTKDTKRAPNALVKIEKKLIAYDGEKTSVRFGDSYEELGKGIALSLYSDTAFGIDTTLEGASFQYRNASVKGGAFAGRINTLRSPVAISPTPDPLASKDVWLGGINISVKYRDEGQLGFHALGTMNQSYLSKRIDQRQYTLGTSLNQEGIFGVLDLYLEGNYLNTELLQPSTTSLPAGFASYGSLSLTDRPWRFKLEGKDYQHFNYEWQRPPTLEEDVIRQNNFKDVTAVRASVERRILEEGSGTLFTQYLVGQDREIGSTIHHPVLGMKFPIGKPAEVELKTGHRWVVNRNSLFHALAKMKLKTGKGQSLELEYRKQFWTLEIDRENQNTEERNGISIGYIFGERFSTLVAYEYIPTNEIESGKNFFNVGGTYHEDRFSLRSFIGQTSGGTQCNGGVCRMVPPYTGAYLEGTVSL